MKLEKERIEKVYKYDLDCTKEEEAQLKKIAIERFAKDERAQLEYAVVTLLKEAVDLMEEAKDTKKEPKKSRKKKQESEDGSANNNR